MSNVLSPRTIDAGAANAAPIDDGTFVNCRASQNERCFLY